GLPLIEGCRAPGGEHVEKYDARSGRGGLPRRRSSDCLQEERSGEREGSGQGGRRKENPLLVRPDETGGSLRPSGQISLHGHGSSAQVCGGSSRSRSRRSRREKGSLLVR